MIPVNMLNPRKIETQAAYEQFKKKHAKDTKRLHVFDLSEEKIIKEFKHWVIIENRFPYDEMVATNHMLVSRRPIASHYESNEDEQAEYHTIIQTLCKEGFYDALIENFPKVRSVTKFAHTHLIVWHTTTHDHKGN